LSEITGTIGDEAVRRYYRQHLDGRLRTLFMPAPAARRTGSPPNRGGGAFSAAKNGAPGRFGRFGRPLTPQEALRPVSPQFGTSSLVRNRTGLPAREALILLVVFNHPWLLDHHAEELAQLEFRHADADRLRRAMLDATASHEPLAQDALAAAIEARGL